MKKKRKLRIDRLFIIAFILISILSIIGLIIKAIRGEIEYKPVKKVDEELCLVEPLRYRKQKESNLIYLGEFRLTGYCDCEECQEEWVGTTALGVAPQANHTIAVDPDVIPLGSHVMIDGVEYVAEDVGGMINDNHIDVFVGSHEECFNEEYNKYAEVYVVEKYEN